MIHVPPLSTIEGQNVGEQRHKNDPPLPTQIDKVSGDLPYYYNKLYIQA